MHVVHLSKKEIPKALEQKLDVQLSSLFVAQQRDRDSKKLLYELFTASERLMLAKRLGILMLLRRDYSLYNIAAVLSVSESTVARMKLNLDRGKYKHIVETIERKEYRESIIGTLETLLTLGLPGNARQRLKTRLKADIEAWRSGAK